MQTNASNDPHPGHLIIVANVGARLIHLLFKSAEDTHKLLETSEISVELNGKVLIRKKKAKDLLMSFTKEVGRGIFLQLPVFVDSDQQVTLLVWHNGEQLTIPVTH